MRPDLHLSYLRTLIAIDEAGSFRAASEAVGRTQSAVTQQMQTLERLIGTPLFVTKGRRRELTEAGRTLLRRSHDIVALCDQAVRAAFAPSATGSPQPKPARPRGVIKRCPGLRAVRKLATQIDA